MNREDEYRGWIEAMSGRNGQRDEERECCSSVVFGG
jgi:hypothetical protein